MLKKFTTQILMAAMILLLSCSDLVAQTRIRFRKGTTSATFSDKLTEGGQKYFVLNAKAGQKVTIRVTSGNNKVIVVGLGIGDAGGAVLSEKIQNSGDNSIALKNTGKATNFRMTVSIR